MARGEIQKYRAGARIADTPEYVVGGGEAAAALQALGGSVAGRLKQMADKAAAQEGMMAGLNAGQAAGAGYLERQNAIATAAPGEYDLSVHVPKGREAHLAGIQPQMRSALAQLMAAAPEDIRSQITLKSGRRTTERQAQLYQEALAKYGSEAEARKWVAPPGRSRHDKGDAYDLGYGSPAAREWVHANAGRFGLAFPLANEDWHIELATARGGGAPAAPATGGLNPQPLALRNDTTIYGGAFDEAALRTYGWRMQQGVSTQLGDAFEQFKDDPAGWNNAVAGIRDQFSQDPNFGDPRVRDAFDRSFAERSEAYSRSVLQRHEQRLIAEQSAAFNGAMDAQISDLEKQAYLLGANPDADVILGDQAKRVMAQIGHAEASKVITAAEARVRRDALETTLAYARTEGVFASLETPAAQQAFANALLTDWAEGKGPHTHLNFNQVKALSDQLAARAIGNQNKLTAESAAERARLQGLIDNDVASIAATGVGLDTAANQLTPERLEALGLDPVAWSEARDLARRGWEATAGMEAQTAGEISDRLTALAPRPGAPDFTAQAAIYNQAVKTAQDVLKERETDPLGQAARAGAITLQPMDFSSPEAMSNSLALRAQQGQAVADMYGVPATYFRAEERTQIANMLLDQPELLPGFAVTIRDTFGERAGRALSEVSEAGPELAHAAGIVLATGDTSVALDVARVMSGRKEGTIKVKMPTEAQMQTAAQSIVGPALGLNPQTRAATLNIAGMLFEKEAAALGFDPADIKDPGSAAYTAYQNAINRALGARQVNGQQYGGMAVVNGAPIVAPTNMASDKVESLLHSLRPEQLELLPPMATGNGIAITAGELANARLLTVGDGQYAVALGDPNGFTPNLVHDPQGQPWILDMYELERMVPAAPDEPGFFAVPNPAVPLGRLLNWQN